jgi:hypothetical protein
VPAPPAQPVSAKSLGQILLAKGWITADQLHRAVQLQKGSTLRLGTCLLEIDALPEDVLLRALAEQLNTPAARAEDLRGIPDDVIETLPAKLALRARAIPFRASASAVDVALLDPRNLTLHDEIGFALGKRAKIHVALEIRVLEALEKYYRGEVSTRVGNLLDRINRARFLWASREPAPGSPATAPPAEPAAAPFASQLPAFDLEHQPLPPGLVTASPSAPLVGSALTGSRWPEPASASPGPRRPSPHQVQPPPDLGPPAAGRVGRPEAPPAVVTPPSPAPPAPTPPPKLDAIPLAPEERDALRRAAQGPSLLTRPELEARLADPESRDHVASSVVDFLAQTLPRVAVLMARKDGVAGWLARGRNVDAAAFERFEIDYSRPSVFLNLRQGSAFYRGPLAPLPVHRELAQCWGGKLPRECILVPVRLKERLVSVLYADTDGREATLDLDLFQDLANRMAAALERCIVKLKAAKPTATPRGASSGG